VQINLRYFSIGNFSRGKTGSPERKNVILLLIKKDIFLDKT